VNARLFGKVIGFLKGIAGLTRRARIRIFKVFIKNKINHLIPLIAVTECLPSLWKCVRRIILRMF
jgi:hypothetical protein